MSSRADLRWLLPGFVAVALVCRLPITSLPPALATISRDLQLTPTLAGLTTTLPLICFGLFAFVTPFLVARWGTERTLLAATALTVVGVVVRSLPTTPTFYLGTVALGLGIAVMNVVLPAVVRSRFPDQVPQRMSLYTVCMISGASAAAAATAPLLQHGLSWSWTLAIWVLPLTAALVLWGAATREVVRHPTGGHASTPQAPTGMVHVVRHPRTWWTAAFMGLQSLCFYMPLTWLPAILRSHGVAPATAGVMLGVYMGLGIPGSFLGPRMATHRHATRVLAAFFAAYALGVVALLGSATTALLGVVVMGFGQGAGIAIALTFIAQQRDPHDVPAVSAFAQGTGFLLAAVGPVTAGAVYQASGSWTVPVLLILAVALAQAVSGLVLSRPTAASASSQGAPARS